MVLQQAPASATLWGWTKNVGASVVVTFNGRNISAISNVKLMWSVNLPPTPAGGPYSITISGEGNTVTWNDILFGEVWFCSGQSNMQMTVSNCFNAANEIKEAGNYPHIRVFTVGQGTSSETPLESLGTVEQPWAVSSSQSIGGKDWGYFSAACWYFGKNLYKSLNVPIGLVSTNWGGTFVEQWSSSDVFKTCKSSVDPKVRSNLYNAMIVPFLHMKAKGAIWYQAESNINNYPEYPCLFQTMIKDWRAKFGLGLPFYFVQLAAYTQGTNMNFLSEMRLAQAETMSKVPNTGMATAVDLGDINSPAGNIHPRDKLNVGVRLSLHALSNAYGKNNIVSSGPEATGAKVISTNPAVVEVSFRKETIGQGLDLRTAVCIPGAAQCDWFDILLPDGKWYNATVQVVGEKIHLKLGNNAKATGVRYGMANWPVITLYNKEGLPAPPFRFTNIN